MVMSLSPTSSTPVAVAGMKTSCGATLIPRQFTDTVEYAGGGAKTAGAGSATSSLLAAAPAALAVHVEAENYAAGETVLVMVENDDGSEIVAGSKAIQLEAVVGADGQAKLMNAFGTRTVEIGTIA